MYTIQWIGLMIAIFSVMEVYMSIAFLVEFRARQNTHCTYIRIVRK